ncbi:MAG: GGDEF domain-containing protein [Lachnospiraceae bacterium]|nr:GGDEF domain-containing protein [Lachnospiraceae bacterium]
MSDKGKDSKQIVGIHIKNVNYAFIMILAFFAIVLFVIAQNIYSEYKEIEQLADDYERIQQDGQNVHEASDYLTKNAQLFVMWGDTACIDNYFREANEVKRRQIAIEDLKELNASSNLIELLENSVVQSMELMQLEYIAMRYAAEGYHLNISELPQEVQDVVLPEGTNKLTDQQKLEKAKEYALGDEYYAYKSRIEGYVTQYLDHALAEVSDKRDNENAEMKGLIILLHISLAIVCVISIILFVTISRMIIKPLNNAVDSISKKRKIEPLEGTYEIKYMSHVYNEFHSDSVEIQKQLKKDAERDSLTGVLNRRGHQTVIERLSSETYPLAFLLVDIDDFKSVNDTYGHETGDDALMKLAKVLLETFRTTDITSRVGGDEFVVIMGETTEDDKAAIEQKAQIINERLSVPGPNKCPALTVSIGCAFSHAGYNNHIFNEADKKMYEIKHKGGNGIQF